MDTPDFRALCAELLCSYRASIDRSAEAQEALIAKVSAALETVPVVPEWYRLNSRDRLLMMAQDMRGRAVAAERDVQDLRAILANFGTPTPAPVPVAERLALLSAGIQAGYARGHEDTVEACYGSPEDVAADLAPQLLQEAAWALLLPEPTK